MYCKYCGNQINENAIACLSCGCDPRKGNQYCYSCGIHTNPNQVICVRCGVGLKNQSISFDTGDFISNLKNSMSNWQQSNGSSNSSNKIALAASVIAAISVFLPWIEVSSSASFGGYTGSYSTGSISGISIGGGIFGLLLALAGGFMAFKNMKFAFIAGAINFLNGLGYMLGWFGASGGGSYSSTYGGGYASANFDPKIGLFLFLLSSLVFAIFTYKNFKASNTA